MAGQTGRQVWMKMVIRSLTTQVKRCQEYVLALMNNGGPDNDDLGNNHGTSETDSLGHLGDVPKEVRWPRLPPCRSVEGRVNIKWL